MCSARDGVESAPTTATKVTDPCATEPCASAKSSCGTALCPCVTDSTVPAKETLAAASEGGRAVETAVSAESADTDEAVGNVFGDGVGDGSYTVERSDERAPCALTVDDHSRFY